VQSERTVSEVETRLWQTEFVEIGALIDDGGVGAFSAGPRQHLLRQVEAEQVPGSLRSRPAAEPAEPAAKIDNAQAIDIRQHRAQCRPFRRAVQTLDRTAETAIAFKEIGLVVDVLCHGCPAVTPAA